MIRAALFDFGGVVTASPFDAFARYERERGLPEGLIRTINATNPDANAWARLERGEVDVERFCELFEAEALALGQLVDAREVLGSLGGEVRPEMVDAVRRCRARCRTACLTNNFQVAGGDRPGPAEALGLFDVVLESSKLGVRKPDRRFYELACEALEVEPHEAVFLDDLGVNLKPARAMGMHTIKVVDPQRAIRELLALVEPEGAPRP